MRIVTDKATFKYIQDPGHGWLEVPRNLLAKLDIEHEISSFSYVDRSRAYLEEDSDMTTFIEAFKKHSPDVDLDLLEIHVNHDSFIRNLMRYHQPHDANK